VVLSGPRNRTGVIIAMALVGTLTGMALGLLIGSAKTYYGTQSNELTQVSASVALLGRVLQHYGPEANGVQESLRVAVERVLAENWSNERAENWKISPKTGHVQEVYEQLRALAPKDEEHRMMQSEALGLLRNLAQLRWLIIAQSAATILQPMLFVMIFWMTSIFVSWGLFSSANAIVSNDLFCSCVVRVWCNFSDPWTEYALRWVAAPFKRAAPYRL
jgi:hypothetical protein